MANAFHAQGGLFFIVSEDRAFVRIVKTDGPHPDVGGRIIFEDSIAGSTFVSAFLATSVKGETDGWWAFLSHWNGTVDLVKDAAETIARSLTRCPVVVHPVIGTVYRDPSESRAIVEVVDSKGRAACEHLGQGAYGNLIHTGNSDGSGMIRECPCGFRSHTIVKMCRHEWVTVTFYAHNMEQRYTCRLCGLGMSTGGFPLNDPRRTKQAERLDGVT